MVGLGTLMAQMADRMTSTTPALANPVGIAHGRAVEADAGRPAAAASAFPATPAVISRPKAGSMASVSASWSIPAPR